MFGEGFSWFNLIPTIVAATYLLWFFLTNNNSPSPSSSSQAAAAEAEADLLPMFGEGFSWFNLIATIVAATYLLWFFLTNNNSPSPSSSSQAEAEAAAAEAEANFDLPPCGECEVFLSFRGPDTRDRFTDFLYTYLHDVAGVRTFRDNDKLRVGKEIGPELLKAIKGSKISIPIFSRNYASSEWCLRELKQIWDCHTSEGQMIFPIFYDVDPDTVKHQRGNYEEAFRRHRKRGFNEMIVQGWEKSLREVGRLKGFELKKETGGREGELVKVIVQEVLLTLKKNYTHVPENLVGMEHHEEEMKRLLEVESSGVRIVGIHGMGGLGKTTIAKVIYNQLCKRFEHCCFLNDVRGKSEKDEGIVKLQEKLLSKIQNRDKAPGFVDSDEGSGGMIKKAVRGKKVLLVLDNVDNKFHFDMLAGNHNWFGDGSRIIIATRNKEVLDKIEMNCRREGLLEVYRSYKPEMMTDGDSLQLFCKHAFMRDSPPKGYDDLTQEFVFIAAKLPLVLVTLGSSLFAEENKDIWAETLRRLKTVPNNEVIGKLRFSFDALGYYEKQIFLDIASFFNGIDKLVPCYFWDACDFYPSNGTRILVRRSLITIDGEENTIMMHDSLKDLGKQIIREEGLSELGKRSRLWGKEALQVLEASQGTENVKALWLISDGQDYLGGNGIKVIAGEKFVRLPNLKFLALYGFDFDGDFKDCLQNLRWLVWVRAGGDPVRFTATNFCLSNLVILQLVYIDFTEDSNIWTQIKMSKELKVLEIHYCTYLTRVPSLSTFSNLEKFCASDCRDLTSLDGIEELESLKYLDARCCSSLKTLPNLSRLKKLEKLNVSGSKLITEIPGLDKLESLEDLYMRGCRSLERLPDLSNLRKLRNLDVSSCTKLIEIRGLGGLESLEFLAICNYKGRETIFDLSNLQRLRYLKAQSCRKLIEIHGLEGLESLECLDVRHCRSIRRLPDLSNLKERLDASPGSALIKIQGQPNFGMLKKIILFKCDKLYDVEGLRVAESLEILDLSYCRALGEIIELRNLKNLKKLWMRSLSKLIEIWGLEELNSLELFDIGWCKSIKRLPDVSNLKKLELINASNCKQLIEIRGLDKLESLIALFIRGSGVHKYLPYLQDSRIRTDYDNNELRNYFSNTL